MSQRLLPCPRCATGVVAVAEKEWCEPVGGRRRSVWVDEPVACGRGCVLGSLDVERVLRLAYKQQGQRAVQLSFLEPAA